MKSCLAVLMILVVPSLALAEIARPSTESVTVTGTRDRQVLTISCIPSPRRPI
jgi:hypothetical protein